MGIVQEFIGEKHLAQNQGRRGVLVLFTIQLSTHFNENIVKYLLILTFLQNNGPQKAVNHCHSQEFRGS